MLKIKHDFIDFRLWSGLFLSYGDRNVKANISDMQPYLYFFCAFIGNLLLYPIIPADGFPHSKWTSGAGTFAFISLVAFMCLSRDWMVAVSFGVNVLAKHTYEMDKVATPAIELTRHLYICRRAENFITIVQVLICLIAACILTFAYMTPSFKNAICFATIIPDLKLDAMPIIAVCRLGTQLRHNWDLAVAWEGDVSQIQITSAKNLRSWYIKSYLPRWPANFVTCFWNESIIEQCQYHPNPFCEESQYILKHTYLQEKFS
uniref:Wolframin cysteine-rich domain-containing protein n=1 Tax=Glossina austeni TaxID=7395 RepID=A0A1A9USJ9_GLOAU